MKAYGHRPCLYISCVYIKNSLLLWNFTMTVLQKHKNNKKKISNTLLETVIYYALNLIDTFIMLYNSQYKY